MVKFLEGARDWLGADTAHFIWCDHQNFEPANYSGDGFTDISLVQRYFSHNSKVAYPGVVPAFTDLMRSSGSGTLGCNEPSAKAYLRSDLYQDVLSPCDARYMLYLVACDVHGSPRGWLSLLRSSTDKPFSSKDHKKLLQIEPYLRYALSGEASTPSGFDSADQEGMVVLDQKGTPLYQDNGARRLLCMASHDRIDLNALIHLDLHNITPHLRRLHRRLVAVFEGQDVGPSVFECRNNWGRFVFRGSWLAGPGQSAIGVRVQHYIPRALKAWAGLHRLDLAPRQQQVALLFSEGLTASQISERLGISRHTVPEYVQLIYERLNIAPNREALQTALLS